MNRIFAHTALKNICQKQGREAKEVRDIKVIVRHIPMLDGDRPNNYVGMDVDAPDYQIVIYDRELTEAVVNKGIAMILQTEKSRQHGNADSSKGE